MAHYKRGKCRKSCPRAIRGSEASRRAHLGIRPARIPDHYEGGRSQFWPRQYWFPMGYPAWWDRSMMTPQWRAECRRLERLIERGGDPEAIAWPRWGRPHKFYW